MARLSVLIIDYCGKCAKNIAEALRGYDYQSQLVSTGSQAQVQLAFTAPDLVILDSNVPDVPIEAILRQIKAQRRLRNTRLILAANDTQTARTFSGKVDAILPMPINPAKLHEVITQMQVPV